MKIIQKVIKENSILIDGDCFTIASVNRNNVDKSVHYHDVYELNLLINIKNNKRIVGDHTELVDYTDLVLIGPNVAHAWIENQCISNNIKHVKIQFTKDLFDDKLLKKNQFFLIKNMLENSHRGLLFSDKTTKELTDRILQLDKKSGFDSVLEFFSIFHDLSISKNMHMLSSPDFCLNEIPHEYSKIERIFDYLNANFDKQISLSAIAQLVNMTEQSISRLIKMQTGNTFIDHLNKIRLSHATRLLVDSSYTIGEIANLSGYSNISNFNRIFKSKKNCIPKEFRDTYSTRRRVFF